jgi:hypothetical protein
MSPEDRRAKQAPLTASGARLKSPQAYFFVLDGGGFFRADRPFWAILARQTWGSPSPPARRRAGGLGFFSRAKQSPLRT